MDQRSDLWHERRLHSIGASDASAILGCSPWKTAIQLWEEKIGISKRSEYVSCAMQRGIDLEDEARQIFNLLLNCMYQPIVCVHDEYSWMMASLDGYCEKSHTIVEIKCPSESEHLKTVRSKKVPDKYYPQIQHQIFVTGVECCYYMSYNPNSDVKYVIFVVNSDMEYQTKLLSAEKEFWQCICNLTPPKPNLIFIDNYIDKSDSLEFCHLRDKYKHLDMQIKELEKLREKVRNDLIDMTDGHQCHAPGIKITKTTTKGRVDYDSLVQKNKINIEEFRHPCTESWRITID